LLKEIEKANGANQNIGDGSDPKVLTRKDAAKDAGLSERQAKQSIRVANVPEPTLGAVVRCSIRGNTKVTQNEFIPAHSAAFLRTTPVEPR
jgi:hypothetical protein